MGNPTQTGQFEEQNSPGGGVTSNADTVVGVGATVALPVPGANNVRRATYQNTNTVAAATEVRIREASGTAGAGVLLSARASATFGVPGGSIQAMEAEHVAGAGAAAVASIFED